VPAGDAHCPFIAPEIGITSTPVIDPVSGTLYVLARTMERTGFTTVTYWQRLPCARGDYGGRKVWWAGRDSGQHARHGDREQRRDRQFQCHKGQPASRAAIEQGLGIHGMGSSCDEGPYHGWVMAYDAHSLRQKSVFNASPDGDDAGIWEGDTGPAADEAGHVFLATGMGLSMPEEVGGIM